MRQGLPSSQILASYIGLLTERKSGFEAIESKQQKEGVGRTSVGYDGFAPIAVYLGAQEGYCLALELRDGTQHSAKESEYTLERALPRALALTEAKLLLRWDAGFDSARMFATALEQGAGRVDVLGKWNPRRPRPLRAGVGVRWIGLPPVAGGCLLLAGHRPSAWCDPVIECWSAPS